MSIVYSYSHDLKDRIFSLGPGYMSRKIPIHANRLSLCNIKDLQNQFTFLLKDKKHAWLFEIYHNNYNTTLPQ